LIKTPLLRWLLASLTVVFTCAWGNPLLAQTNLSRESLVTSYIYNFIRFIDWPNEGTLQQFTIAVPCGVTRPLRLSLEKVTKSKTIKGLPLRVQFSGKIRTIKDAQVVYLPENCSAKLEEIFSLVDGTPTLVITDGHQEKRLVMINFIATAQGTLTFEINKPNPVPPYFRVVD